MRTQALIIRKQKTGEHDQLITCYTREHGKLMAIAKGSLKSSSLQSMQLDTFNLVEFELVNGRAVPIIAAAECLEAHHGIRQSLSRLATAYFFGEVVERIVFDHQRDDQLWNFLLSVFGKLNQEGASLSLFRQWQAELLGVLGYSSADHHVLTTRSFSVLDEQFENTAQRRFSSLPFLYSVLK